MELNMKLNLYVKFPLEGNILVYYDILIIFYTNKSTFSYILYSNNLTVNNFHEKYSQICIQVS